MPPTYVWLGAECLAPLSFRLADPYNKPDAAYFSAVLTATGHQH